MGPFGVIMCQPGASDGIKVIDAEEELFEMNNGCICCTVRGDLIRILGNLMTTHDVNVDTSWTTRVINLEELF